MRLESLRKLPATIILIFVSLLIALRFFHLDADFPLGKDWSGDLYTDEGWYANAAVREVISGRWYLPGDFNPAVNLPMGQLLQRAAFGVFGLGLISARITGALASSAVILLAALVVRRGAGVQAGLLTSLILASSYIGFAFSRLAILEPIGVVFVMSALFVSQRMAGRPALPLSILSGLLVSAAVLVKGTMIFAIPVVAYAAWLSGRGGRERLRLVGVFLLVSFVTVGGWQIIARHFFQADFIYFETINLGARQVTGIGDWVSNLHRQWRNMQILGRGFVDVLLLLVILAGVTSANFRAMPLVRLLVLYAVAYFSLLSIVSFGPPRYFVPLLVPLAGLGAIACIELTRWCRQARQATRIRLLALLPGLLVVMMVFSGCGRIAAYMARPHYSLLRMATSVRTIIDHREGRTSGVVLLGNMADTVALVTGVRAVNTHIGVLPLAERLETYRPSYVLIHTDEAAVMGAIRASGGHATRLGAWDVYGNYYGSGQDIQLFGIDWDRASQRQTSPSSTLDQVTNGHL